MNSFAVAGVAFISIFGGAMCGLLAQGFLPKTHLGADSKDAVKLGAGLIATMAALILGLLVASSKSTFDVVNSGLTQTAAKVIYLDRVLAGYGPESKPARDELKAGIANATDLIWPEEAGGAHGSGGIKALEGARAVEVVGERVRDLVPQTESQHLLKAQAQQIAGDILQSRWLLFEQRQASLPPALLVVTLFWLSMLNFIYGLFAPRNHTVVAVLLACSLSISGAIFLIIEMGSPLDGFIKVSSAPMRRALQDIGN